MAIDRQLDCYAILEISPNADDAAVRAAYKALLARHEQSRPGTSKDEARRHLSHLTTAYEVLSNPQRRRRYDFHRRIHARIDPLRAELVSSELPASVPPQRHARASSRLEQRRRRLALVVVSVAIVFVASVYATSAIRGQRHTPALEEPEAPLAAEAKAPVVAAPARSEVLVPAPTPPFEASAPVSAPAVAASPPRAPVAEKTVAAGRPTPQPPERTRRARAATPAPVPCTDATIALGLCTSARAADER